jgi:hypothetical protein
MSSLTTAQLSFLFRQESLIEFGLGSVFYGVYNGSWIHMTLMDLSPGVYAALVAFLVYFFREDLACTHNNIMSISTRNE